MIDRYILLHTTLVDCKLTSAAVASVVFDGVTTSEYILSCTDGDSISYTNRKPNNPAALSSCHTATAVSFRLVDISIIQYDDLLIIAFLCL